MPLMNAASSIVNRIACLTASDDTLGLNSDSWKRSVCRASGPPNRVDPILCSSDAGRHRIIEAVAALKLLVRAPLVCCRRHAPKGAGLFEFFLGLPASGKRRRLIPRVERSSLESLSGRRCATAWGWLEVDCQTFPQREGIQAWRSAKQFANLLGVPLSGIG